MALLQLTKPSVTRLVLVTTLCGAAAAPGPIDLLLLVTALVGTALVVGAANTLNMYLERDTDALMERTRNRPLPSGRLTPEVALWFGLALSVAGLSLLSFAVNALTGLLAAIALISYVLLYTPLKRVAPIALYVGAIPGAIPPLLGYSALAGELGLEGLLLFGILFVWQLPHFVAIAIFRQAEYERAGLQVLPVRRGLAAAKLEMVVQLVVLLAVSLLPVKFGIGGAAYAVVAALAGLGLLGWGLMGLRASAGVSWARSLFFASMPYLVIVFGAFVLTAS